MKIELIGLSGKAGSGKDTIAKNLLRPLGYFPFAFAWHGKVFEGARCAFTFEELFHTKPEYVREHMQQALTEFGRGQYGEDIWVNCTFMWMELLAEAWGITKFMITDVRFVNEAEAIKARGGKVIRIHAPLRVEASNLTPEQRTHSSETSLDGYTRFDGVILNDPGLEPPLNDIKRLLEF